MKYVVTQKQIDGLRETILNYLDNNLTPYDGWESPKSYKKEREESGEVFLHFVDADGPLAHKAYDSATRKTWNNMFKKHRSIFMDTK
jgi:hypothetical protein